VERVQQGAELKRAGYRHTVIFTNLIMSGLESLMETPCPESRKHRLEAFRTIVTEMLGEEEGEGLHLH
jgi:hypothetical protein